MQLMKKDPANLIKLKHPQVLNLVEQPGEDDKYIVYITEPVEFSLACLLEAKPGGANDHLVSKIPSELETKCMMLELLEAMNFLH